MPTGRPSLKELNAFNSNTLCESLGIEFTELSDDYIKAKMPVDHRTVQPFRILHGGASVALAETLGSVGALMTVGSEKIVVGVEINANHLKSVSEGFVHGTARPVRVGNTVQVWNIKIVDDHENLVCVSRLTVLVKEK